MLSLRPRTIALSALLCLTCALLAGCGASTKALIPSGDAGPLLSDVELVEHAAASGDGSCNATEKALVKITEDFSALPATVNSGLRNNVRQGIQVLHTRALALCAQPLPSSTTSTEAVKPTTTTNTATTPTVAQTTPTQTTPTTSSTTPTEAPHGGTPAPTETPPAGTGQGGGTGAGEDQGAAGGQAPPGHTGEEGVGGAGAGQGAGEGNGK
jgi:hypothetical protein